MYKVQWHFKSSICWWGWGCKFEGLSFFTLSISALPPEVTSEMSLHFLYVWQIGQISIIQIFETRSLYWIITQNIVKDSVCKFCLIKLLIHEISKIWMIIFWPMVHRCKKCSDISEVTSGGRAAIENVKNDRPSDLQCHFLQQMLLLKRHCIFYIYGA